MTPRGSAPGVRQSECSRCPAWTLECAHFAGLTVRLDQRDKQWHRCSMAGFGDVGRNPAVTHAVFGPDAPLACMKGCGALLFDYFAEHTTHTDEAAARAEFERRCTLMLGREEAS